MPQVFEPKAKWRKFDEDLPEWDRSNYASASLNSQQLLEKFREEVELGRMEASTHGALKQRYGEENLRIASMGAIQKPDGSVRPVHDGTHGVHVNQAIPQHNLLSVPGPGELALLVRQSQEQFETPFALAGDVAAAHRLVLVRERDWGLLACRAEAGSDTVFVNRVGTFGISSASFWWARLFGIIGRMVGRAMLNHFFFQLVFVDDLHANFFGHRKYVNALIWLVLYLMAGTPFAWKKFKGGARIAFIGYELDYAARLVGLSKVRGDWLVQWIKSARESKYVVQTKKFAEFLGRLGFVSRVVYWLKPHLAPLYAWSSATHRCSVGKLPDTVILTLLYIEEALVAKDYKVSPSRVDLSDKPLFFTDAKCEDGLVVLGGWDATCPLCRSRWFSIKVRPHEAPYLFDEEQKSQWASASAELLATLAALYLFGHLGESTRVRQLPVAFSAVTDNKGNESLSKKQSTTKWPLMLINMQLSHLLAQSKIRLALNWRPRGENQLADDLTNSRFSSFNPEFRCFSSFSDLPLELLSKLWETKSQFDALRHSASQQGASQSLSKKRPHERTPW